jgi:hypothetical protein
MGTLVVAWDPTSAGAASRPSPARIEVIPAGARALDVWVDNRSGARWKTRSVTSFPVSLGQVRRRRLPPGDYLVRFSHDELTAPDQRITIRESGQTMIDVRPQARAK